MKHSIKLNDGESALVMNAKRQLDREKSATAKARAKLLAPFKKKLDALKAREDAATVEFAQAQITAMNSAADRENVEIPDNIGLDAISWKGKNDRVTGFSFDDGAPPGKDDLSKLREKENERISRETADKLGKKPRFTPEPEKKPEASEKNGTAAPAAVEKN